MQLRSPAQMNFTVIFSSSSETISSTQRTLSAQSIRSQARESTALSNEISLAEPSVDRLHETNCSSSADTREQHCGRILRTRDSTYQLPRCWPATLQPSPPQLATTDARSHCGHRLSTTGSILRSSARQL